MYPSVNSKDHWNCSPSPWHCSRCSLRTGIPTKYIRRHIPKTMENVPLHFNTVHGVHYIQVYQRNVSVSIFHRPLELCPFTLALFPVFITYGYTDKMCPSVYFRDHENCALSPWHYSWCLLHTSIPIKWVRRYIPKTMKTVPLHPDTVYGVHYIGYIDRICPSVYFRDMEYVRRYISETWKLCPFTLKLFMMFITYGYTNEMCP
jgi:hypothetical protein